MYLNGWQRLGVVLSALWWFTCLSLFLIEYTEASPFSSTLFVTHQATSIFSFIPLEIGGLSSSGTVAEINVLMLVAALSVPVLSWILAAAIMIIMSWIAVGFEPHRAEPPVLTNPINPRRFKQELVNQVE